MSVSVIEICKHCGLNAMQHPTTGCAKFETSPKTASTLTITDLPYPTSRLDVINRELDELRERVTKLETSDGDGTVSEAVMWKSVALANAKERDDFRASRDAQMDLVERLRMKAANLERVVKAARFVQRSTEGDDFREAYPVLCDEMRELRAALAALD